MRVVVPNILSASPTWWGSREDGMATKTKSKLEQARETWGSASVLSAQHQVEAFGQFPTVTAPRLSRVAEQIRNIDGHQLDRSTTR